MSGASRWRACWRSCCSRCWRAGSAGAVPPEGLNEGAGSAYDHGVACVFCSIVAGETPAHVVHQDDDFVAFLDARPVFKGHTLLVPRDHVETLPDLPAESRDGFLEMAQRLATAMRDALGAQGSFVAVNNTVSQSVPHLHLHVVPRTKGDGLRGFFWPRTRYADAEEQAQYAARLRAVLE